MMGEELIESRKANENVNDLCDHRVHSAENTTDVHAREGKEEPVQAPHNEEYERNAIERAHSHF